MGSDQDVESCESAHCFGIGRADARDMWRMANYARLCGLFLPRPCRSKLGIVFGTGFLRLRRALKLVCIFQCCYGNGPGFNPELVTNMAYFQKRQLAPSAGRMRRSPLHDADLTKPNLLAFNPQVTLMYV